MNALTKSCLFCQSEMALFIGGQLDPIEEKFLVEKPAMCRDCARERGLDPDTKYFVFAGDIYQRISNVHVRLWPVGAFH